MTMTIKEAATTAWTIIDATGLKPVFVTTLALTMAAKVIRLGVRHRHQQIAEEGGYLPAESFHDEPRPVYRGKNPHKYRSNNKRVR